MNIYSAVLKVLCTGRRSKQIWRILYYIFACLLCGRVTKDRKERGHKEC